MASQLWRTMSNALKSLRVNQPASLQSRFLNVDAKNTLPEKPKKPLPPYFRFLAKVREDVAKQNPNLNPKELVKLIAQKWGKLDDASKAHYSNAFKEEMGPFTVQLAKYYSVLPAELKHKEEQAKLDKHARQERRDHRKRIKELGKPKKPSTPFFHFIKANMTSQTSDGKDPKERMKEFGVKWRALTETNKAPFVEKYDEEAEAYAVALQKWETAMIKQGNEDVVRLESLPRKVKSVRSKPDLAKSKSGLGKA